MSVASCRGRAGWWAACSASARTSAGKAAGTSSSARTASNDSGPRTLRRRAGTTRSPWPRCRQAVCPNWTNRRDGSAGAAAGLAARVRSADPASPAPHGRPRPLGVRVALVAGVFFAAPVFVPTLFAARVPVDLAGAFVADAFFVVADFAAFVVVADLAAVLDGLDFAAAFVAG